MNPTVLTAIIGGVCTLAATAITGFLVYRRAVKVELAKNIEDGRTVLLDKWREYSEKLEAVTAKQDEKLSALRKEKEAQDEMIADLRRTNREQGARISELEHMIELQARQLAEMERRLGNLEEGEDA